MVVIICPQDIRSSSVGHGNGAIEMCLYCNKQFIGSWALHRHMRTHTGERPYPCPACDYRATTRSNMLRHVNNKHRKNEIANSLQLLP